MYTTNLNVSLSESTTVTKTKPNRKTNQHQPEQRFCPSTSCFTDEISVQRISPQANVWVLTDPVEDQAWFTMGEAPTCPHCGAVLLAANPSR
ncbi:MAG: hypothetical protein NT075_00610 [Chloroflexi bacterium]|nr:hypothetical protein [Chloroflexota bacterium]